MGRSFIEVGACISTNDVGDLFELACSGNDGKNYCCFNKTFTGLIQDAARQECCTYDQYADEHWVSLAIIRVLLVLITFVTILILLLIVAFYLSTVGITEANIKFYRKIILKELLKEQILFKPARLGPSAVTTLKKMSGSLVSSSNIRSGNNIDERRALALKPLARKSPRPARSPVT